MLPHGRTNDAPKVDKYWDNASAPVSSGPAELPTELKAGLPKELTGSLSQVRGNFDADSDHNWGNLNDPDNVDMYDSDTIYTAKPGSAHKLFSLV